MTAAETEWTVAKGTDMSWALVIDQSGTRGPCQTMFHAIIDIHNEMRSRPTVSASEASRP